MTTHMKKILGRLLVAFLLVGAGALAVRSYRALQGPELQPWHTFVPVELRADELDDADWPRYVAQEQSVFDSVRANVTQRLEPDARVPYNRYFEGSPVYPGRFAQDWNRSYVIEPASAPKGAVVLRFGPRSSGAVPDPPAAWVAGAAWLPPDDADVEVRYLDPSRMGKIYLSGPGGEGSVPGTEQRDLGPDADDPALTLEAWRARIRRHPGELKPLLRNQAFVAGIGNAYSDEILWEARLNPFRKRAGLAAEEVDALYDAVGSTIRWALEILRARVAPAAFEKQVRDHLRVHLRGGEACLRCGGTISQVGSREATSWCRTCQR